MARPRLPGWPLEAAGNGGPREMITAPATGVTEPGLQALSVFPRIQHGLARVF